ncbi:MAG: aspartyl-tRNA(Asn)/glutamyl-tRNA(Gln) amidotransferase subunit [Candidatus Poribacteria bacterium]|nr:aspartyl-tRNA(Asn)/glutamyl-tRNA(Gln) amidotransferase subunit [Candidatus Poribacteria bacterium]
MEKITIKQVEHVANLARLRFDEEEKKKLAEHLGEILEYINQLNKLNTDDVEPTSHAIPVKNVVREDVIKKSFTQDEALANAPSPVDGLFEVPKIIE